MSLTLNMVGGGGGGLSATDALLRVQAPAGSTVTITKGTTTKTDLGHENADDHTVYDYYFIIHQSQFDSVNPWTVTATYGSNTATSTVIVDSADEYDVALFYHVPSEYQEVEYLEASGGQYFRTGVKPTQVKGGSFKYMINANVSYAAMWGASRTSANEGSVAYFNSNAGSAGFFYGGSLISINARTIGTEYEVTFTCVTGSQTVVVNGITYTGSSTSTSFADYYIDVFGNNYAGTSKSAERMKGRIYYLTLTDGNGNKVLELYPCYRKSDNVAGMWDKVSETFLTNQGSGSFVVGGDVN